MLLLIDFGGKFKQFPQSWVMRVACCTFSIFERKMESAKIEMVFSLSNLIKHKANEHKPIMSNDK